MAACAVCSTTTLCPSSSGPVVGSSWRCDGTRVVSRWAAMAGDSPIQRLAGCDSSSPSPSTLGRSSIDHVRSRRFASISGARVARGRSVVCEVAVKVGDSQPSGEQGTTKDVKPGSRIRVKAPITVYHVGKVPELNIEGLEGEVKEVLGIFKGKTISATLPIKTQFFIEAGGKQVKFFAHLKDGEYEVVE